MSPQQSDCINWDCIKGEVKFSLTNCSDDPDDGLVPVELPDRIGWKISPLRSLSQNPIALLHEKITV